MPRRLSLRNRLILFAAACLLPLLVVIAVIIAEAADAGRDQVLDAQAATAEVVASVLGTTLSDNQKRSARAGQYRPRAPHGPGIGQGRTRSVQPGAPQSLRPLSLGSARQSGRQHWTRSDTVSVTFRIHRCRRSVAQARGTGRLECPDRSRRAGDRSHHAGTDKRSGRGGADRSDRLPAFGRAAGRGCASLCAR